MPMLAHDSLADEDIDVANGFEWMDGQVVEKPMGLQSSLVEGNLLYLMKAFLATNKVGFVFPSDAGYQIKVGSSRRVRKPDLSFVAMGRFPEDKPPRGNSHIAPDLAVEVISPNDKSEEIEGRVADFMSVGTRLFWIIYPETRTVWVLRKDGSANRLTEAQELTGDDVIPGFKCSVAELFVDV